jgi:ABC-type amino acid transport substrate-binding protein
MDIEWAASYPEMIELLRTGAADVAVAPLAPTLEREEIIDFSSAVVSSGPQYGVHERLRSPASLLRAVLSSRVLRLLLIALGGLIVLGHLIWLIERRSGNDHFHDSYARGVFDGVWWAASTVTTVGYGDKAPRSVRGRLLAMFAMLLSLFLVGAFVSEISRDIADQAGNSVTSVEDRTVAVVSDTTFADYVRAQGVDTLGFASQADVFDAAARGDVDVVLASPFAIAALGPDHDVRPIGSVLYEEFETFGLQQGSPLRERINGVLAELQSEGKVAEVIDRWLG